MALAVNRTGTIVKKCDRSNHSPNSNKRCADGTCQHTCEPSQVEKCPHSWTLRYSLSGKQLEKSFKDTRHETTGRVNYGSGKKLAQDFQLKLTVDKRAGDITFADHGKTGKVGFGSLVEAFISRLAIGDNSREQYMSTYRTHVKHVFADMTLAQVAKDRDGVTELVTVTMKERSDTLRKRALYLIVGTCEEAVKAGKIGKHLLTDIDVETKGTMKARSDFVFPTHEQVRTVADGGVNSDTKRPLAGAGICVWLMRGCGLRIEESLAVEKADFKENGTILRVMYQASRDGRKKLPLKHRKQGQYRDVPVPSWLWEMVNDMPDGPLSRGHQGKTHERYSTVRRKFMRAAKEAGIPTGFTPHSLRHAYASAMLAQGVNINELAIFLGHKDINVTHQIYGHLLPSAAKRAVAALDTEFAEWSKGA
jgi:integrase